MVPTLIVGAGVIGRQLERRMLQHPELGFMPVGFLDDDPSLSVRGDAAEECWRIVQPAIDAWRADDVPLDEYPAGSEGPESWPTV